MKEITHVITKTDELQKLCERLKFAAYITVDTEFMREHTYWPILCLIQVGTPDEAHAIDPMAHGLDLSPFFDLMTDSNILKVFHAARQDIEIFVHLTGKVPHPLFDSQVAAMVCGFGEQAGYETLVSRLVGANLDKSARFTDWSHRPLTPRQVEYALGDVTHLCIVYEKLAETLAENGRTNWLDEEMAVLMRTETYLVEPDEAWLRIKSRNRNRRFLALVKELAAWREREAQNRDVPRGRIVKDETLLEIAALRPANLDTLEKVRGISKRYSTEPHGNELLDVIAKALKIPDSELPAAPPAPAMIATGPETDLLKLLLKMKSQEHGVAAKLVATSEQLEDLATVKSADNPLLKGWRWELFGREASAILRGEVGFAVRHGNLVTFEVDSLAP
jgi:ribonuclease D